jgi:group I intron endonuclease
MNNTTHAKYSKEANEKGKVEKGTCGIYKIVNIVNDKLYVGSSSNIPRRWSRHLSKLRRNCHDNQYLQNAFDKHGENSFIFIVIEQTQKDELFVKEQYWFDETKCYIKKYGYNIQTSADGSVAKHIKCKVKNCNGKYQCKGYCNKHYKRLKKHGTVSDAALKMLSPMKNRGCKVKGCNGKHKTKGYCVKHYSRLIDNGSVSETSLTRLLAIKNKTCKVKGCNKKYYCKGYCAKHYSHFRYCGSPYTMKKNIGCKIKGCDRKYKAKGYCDKHYQKMMYWLKH